MVDINPYLVSDANASGIALTPIPVRDKAFQEDWLQELLFKPYTLQHMRKPSGR
jgi:hypothetical protein